MKIRIITYNRTYFGIFIKVESVPQKDLVEEIMKIITEKNTLEIVDKEVNRYIEICTLFDSLFSFSRTPCGEMNDEKLK